jgi:uncharacterized protein (DUF736 family)
MATIGTFKATDHGYEGNIETLTLKAKVTIESAKKNSETQPDYRVFHITDAFKSEIGAAWKKTSRDSGGEYLSGSIDDPSFAARVNFRLVKSGAEVGYTLYWDRPRPEQD